MAQDFIRSGVAGIDRVTFDAGLRSHMLRVFNYMAGGLVVTGIMAYLVANTALAGLVFGTPLRWLVMIAPLGFMMYMNIRMQSISVGALQTLFWCFCGTMGLSMGAIFLVYTKTSIEQTFFITAATFAAMSLWGYSTKRDLTGFGSFLLMGVLGLMIASLINIFAGSTGLQWIISIVGVAVFTGLTAFDVQRIKQTYSESWGVEANSKLAVFAALSLYLNFINAFQFMLELTGSRRN